MHYDDHNSRRYANKYQNDLCCTEFSLFQECWLTEQRASIEADRDISCRELLLKNNLIELVRKHQGLCKGKQQHSTTLVIATQDGSVPAHTPKWDTVYRVLLNQSHSVHHEHWRYLAIAHRGSQWDACFARSKPTASYIRVCVAPLFPLLKLDNHVLLWYLPS